MLQKKKSLVEFKLEVLKGLQMQSRRRHACFLCLRKQKREIKALLVRQLSDRHELKTMYINIFEMTENNKRVDKMWETKNRNKEPFVQHECCRR